MAPDEVQEPILDGDGDPDSPEAVRRRLEEDRRRREKRRRLRKQRIDERRDNLPRAIAAGFALDNSGEDEDYARAWVAAVALFIKSARAGGWRWFHTPPSVTGTAAEVWRIVHIVREGRHEEAAAQLMTLARLHLKDMDDQAREKIGRTLEPGDLIRDLPRPKLVDITCVTGGIWCDFDRMFGTRVFPLGEPTIESEPALHELNGLVKAAEEDSDRSLYPPEKLLRIVVVTRAVLVRYGTYFLPDNDPGWADRPAISSRLFEEILAGAIVAIHDGCQFHEIGVEIAEQEWLGYFRGRGHPGGSGFACSRVAEWSATNPDPRLALVEAGLRPLVATVETGKTPELTARERRGPDPEDLDVTVHEDSDFAEFMARDGSTWKLEAADVGNACWARLREWASAEGELKAPNPKEQWAAWTRRVTDMDDEPPASGRSDEAWRRFKRDAQTWHRRNRRLNEALQSHLAMTSGPIKTLRRQDPVCTFRSIRLA